MTSRISKSKSKLEQGTLTLDNGCVYEGELLNGECHGLGTLTHPEGFRYEGQFKNGLPHGKGAASFPSGGSVEGQFKNGEFVE